jgi:hypothetical protein
MSNSSCHLGRWCTPLGRWQAAGLEAIVFSSQRSGIKQPPVQRAGGLLGHRVDRHPSWQLAVLPSVPEYWRCTRRNGRRLWKAGVIHHPRGRRKRADQHLGQPPRHRPLVPRAGGHEVVQRLAVHPAQTRRHRLDRLAPAIQHQPTLVALAPSALISAYKRSEDLGGEGFQASTDRGQLRCCQATRSLRPCAGTGRTGPLPPYPSTTDLTEPY